MWQYFVEAISKLKVLEIDNNNCNITVTYYTKQNKTYLKNPFRHANTDNLLLKYLITKIGVRGHILNKEFILNKLITKKVIVDTLEKFYKEVLICKKCKGEYTEVTSDGILCTACGYLYEKSL